MPRILIDNREIEVPEGSSILEAARLAGENIPTLCYADGVPHYSSCMVCMVRDKVRNIFIPSCSSLVQHGMDIDVSGQEVVSLRKKAVELLLSEHRAECEAPCRVVCPAGYNIPVMNRYLSSHNYEDAYALVAEEMGSGELKCVTCKAYCENACRRKKIDMPVTIRNTRLYIASLLKDQGLVRQELPKAGKIERFSSRTGKIEADELVEWLKESSVSAERFKEIADITNASKEASACMHCDCRAAENCRLRIIAEILGVKDPQGKVVNAPIRKKINVTSGLIFENAKCIKCGLCVRIFEDSPGHPALCFIERGFISIISEPLTASFDEVLTDQSKRASDICPTGALKLMDTGI